MNEFNFVSETVSTEDKELFFGPLLETDTFIDLEPTDRWCHILARVGLFPSVGQAKKNGWDKEIASGWSEEIVGKKKTKIFVFKI